MKDRTKFTIDKGLCSVNFRYEHNIILFDGITEKGLPVTVELDTCTSPNAIRDTLVSEQNWKIGQEIVSDGIGGKHKSYEAEVPFIQIGDLKIENLFANTDPLGGPAKPDVMLGESLLRNLIVEIDFIQKKTTFSLPEHWKCPESDENTHIFNLDLMKGLVPALKNTIKLNNKIEVPLAMLDTGNNSAIVISKDIGNKLNILNTEEQETVKAGGYGGNTEIIKTTIKEIEIGSLTFNNITGYILPSDNDTVFGDPGWINIGNQIFDDFIVTFAVPFNKFIIQKC